VRGRSGKSQLNWFLLKAGVTLDAQPEAACAVLTTRGEDHDMTPYDLRRLARMCIEAANLLEEIVPNTCKCGNVIPDNLSECDDCFECVPEEEREPVNACVWCKDGFIEETGILCITCGGTGIRK
jgi:hypothetical protein